MKKAGDLLSSFFDEKTLKKAQGYGSLFSSWGEIAGEAIAAHSRIAELEHSVLLVEADHPGWVQILQTRQKSLLNAVRRRFPQIAVTAISFRLSREPGPLSPAKPLPAALPPAAIPGENRDAPPADDPASPADTADPAAAALPADPYAGIRDEDFKQTLMRLERSIKRRAK